MQFRVNIQNIQTETYNSILIRMPNKSKYKDFCFWVSKKLVKQGSHKYEILVWLGDNFKIKCTRTGKNYRVLDEKELSAEEIYNAFESN